VGRDAGDEGGDLVFSLGLAKKNNNRFQ